MSKIYVTRQLPEGGLKKLEAIHQVDVNDQDRPLTREELLSVVSQYDAVICLLSDSIDSTVIEAARGKVKIFANYAVGYDNIDIFAAEAAGIYVSNTPGVLTEATADIAWALMLAAARHIVAAHNYTEAGKFLGWHPTEFLGGDFHNATLGIVGAGRIGQAVARRAIGFGMRVLYYSRSSQLEFEKQCGAQKVDLETLLRESDYVSLHVPLTEETKGLLDSRHLEMLKPTAVLVNTARGPVVDEGHLAFLLRSGRLAGAGLDVYAREPKIHPDLFGLDNVVLLPHIGSASWQTRLEMARMASENVLAVLSGSPPLNPVKA